MQCVFAFSFSFSVFCFFLFFISLFPLPSPFLPFRSLLAVHLGNPARDDGCEVIFSRTLLSSCPAAAGVVNCRSV
ncbi:uncharacterized protein BO72DRAFT_312395 [Aspergillus fijiensis CBS 313.89]|uniref:Uncharacterized protein n=1 Tax=Aspergillus fijiensis CBS 313.89 TaxID=1448319 RepID=A0A8G1VST2_9EURO|nr:uncharacterized protein BO72DRAFT_312395 [Aspergillus fijiensis CBS 313.89]RAK71580.1 hypothetical protein BO72DRAFT_312395 [Aspergillus fijiensis CBS 313.89]